TAFYVYHRLVSLNEVGGDPDVFGVEPAEFHAWAKEARERWPRSLLATSTHDTKRGEDVRARIHLLSEMPARWEAAVRRWTAVNERYRRGGFPDRNAEYLFYQTLVGAWPIEPERAAAYMEKAAREARVHTSWTQPHPDYEQALRAFVLDALQDKRFVADVEAVVAPLIPLGRVNSLAQTLLKLTAPGVPDLYQGTELGESSLVAPDNRRPVDYEERKQLLAAVRGASVDEVMARADEGLPKLWLLARTLALRRAFPERFDGAAAYEPLEPAGTRARHALAFVRAGSVAVVVPRLVLGLSGVWGDTRLRVPPGSWRSVLTEEAGLGGELKMADLLRRFPVALLARD